MSATHSDMTSSARSLRTPRTGAYTVSVCLRARLAALLLTACAIGCSWALQRSGAVHIEGAVGVSLHRNQLTRNDGNAVFLGGYTRSVNITSCDFNFIGDSVIALFGWTSDCLWANCSVKLPAKVGPDGRGGEQPRGTNIAGNVIREFGIWQKQSSALFQAIAGLTNFESNVVFNGPRAAINFNDPFLGGWVR